MYTKLTLLLFALVCTQWVQAQTTVCGTLFFNHTSPAGFTKLEINYPTDVVSVNFEFYHTTSDIEVNVTGCAEDISDNNPIISSLQSLLSSGADSVVFALSSSLSTTTTTTGVAATSGASRGAVSLTLLFAMLSLFLFPKNRYAIALLVAILCIGYISAAPTVNLTVRVGLPPQVTVVCLNGVCSNPFSSDSTGSPSGNTGSPSGTTTGTQDTPTSFPTSAPTVAPTAAPTVAPTVAPPTNPPTFPPSAAVNHFNLRALVLAPKPLSAYGSDSKSQAPVMGADFVVLMFASVGMPYDYVVVNATSDLSTSLSTSGTGLYCSIVTVSDTVLSTTQQALVTAYQAFYGVKWAVIGSTGAGLSGITVGTRVTKTSFQLTLNQAFAQYAKALNPAISVANDYGINWSGYDGVQAKLYPVTITDSTTVTPFINAVYADGTTAVAAAAFVMADGTHQLHYFVDVTAEYIGSMAFAPALLDWLSPAGLFIGARRLTLLVQPDDLFLGSFIWDIATHTNPIQPTDPWYRMSATDLQNMADFFDALNARLPAGSYITVEWPTNFGGINDYYTAGGPDDLYLKSLELHDKFYFLSHTWDHPCTFDTLSTTDGYTTMFNEIAQNKNYAPTYFADAGVDMSRWSNSSMITPCVTGLYNSGVMQALLDNGINACVSDESVTGKNTVDFEPITPYHGVWSTIERNGIEGVYFVPRETLDIDYDDVNDLMVVDQYNTENPPKNGKAPLSFEDIMKLQIMYGVQDKIAFRQDPFMLHQTNGATFLFTDALKGTTYNTSLVALWIQRVVDEMLSYYSLPIVAPQMDNLVKIFQQRDNMDACGITATLGISADKHVVDVSIISQNSCSVSLSGGAQLSGQNVKMETVGTETTAWVDLTAGVTSQYTFAGALGL